MASLSRKRFRVELDLGAGETRQHELTTSNRDQLSYEETRHRRKWPAITDGGVVHWWTFLVYRAAIREGLVPADTKYDAWLDILVDVDNLDDDEAVDPTRPGQPAS